MHRSLGRQLLIPALLWVSLGISGCKEESPVESNLPTLPALADPIPFDRLGEGKLVFERVPSGEMNGTIYVVDAAQQRSWGIDPANHGGGVTGPAVSPDGRTIAYVALTSVQTGHDVYIMNIDGGNRQRVSALWSHESCPSWTYDGTAILFYGPSVSSLGAGSFLYRQSPVPNPIDRVIVIDFDSFDLLDLGTPIEPVSASSTGKLLIPKSGVYVTNADGSNPRHVIPPSGTEGLGSPAWSPDGQSIALMSVRRNALAIVSIAVVVYAADGTNPDTLVTLPASGEFTVALCWSPDGTQIAFTKPDSTDRGSHIYLIRKDHSGLTQVTFADGVADRSLSWSH